MCSSSHPVIHYLQQVDMAKKISTKKNQNYILRGILEKSVQHNLKSHCSSSNDVNRNYLKSLTNYDIRIWIKQNVSQIWTAPSKLFHTRVKGALDNFSLIPRLSSKKVEIFILLDVYTCAVTAYLILLATST